MRTYVFVVVAMVLAGLVLGTAPAAAQPLDPAIAAAAAPGPYVVASTTSVGPCVGRVADKQTSDNRRDRVYAPIQCTSAFPIGHGPGTGINFYFPQNTVSPRPLVVFNGGYGANPGFFDRIVRHWASHGYVVAVSYQYGELAPYSLFAGVRQAARLNGDRSSRLFGRIDMRSVVLAGHSYGATNAVHAADLLGLRPTPLPPAFALPSGSKVVGVLAVAPAVGTLTNADLLPTLVISGTDDIVSPPADVRRSWSGVRGPAWLAVFDRATHLSTLDFPSKNPQIGVETAFLDFVTRGTQCAEFAGSGWPGDERVTTAARNSAAREVSCFTPTHVERRR